LEGILTMLKIPLLEVGPIEIIKNLYSLLKKSASNVEVFVWWLVALVYGAKVYLGYEYIMRKKLIGEYHWYTDNDFIYDNYNDFVILIALILIPIIVKMIYEITPMQLIFHLFSHSRKQIKGNVANVDTMPDKSNDISGMAICEYMHQLEKESLQIAEKIYSRAGVYLIVGISIAMSGIFIFAAFPIRIAQDREVMAGILDMLPRFGALFFVEFIAFFFFKQHRIMMDEFRYYESVKRQRQSNLVLVKLSTSMECQTSIDLLSKHMRLFDNPVKINSNQTTELLELRKIPSEEIGILDKILELLHLIKTNKSE